MERAQYETFIKQGLPELFKVPGKPVSAELLGYGQQLTAGKPLTPEEAARAVEIMIDGKSAPYETAFFLTVFQAELSRPEELAAMARAMRARAVRVEPLSHYKILGDNCGTGGDNLHLFNISTVTMFILAAAGMPIAKHGNRASTSRCGSADVLEELGVKIDLGPEEVARCLDRIGIGFMFAPRYHPAMKNVAGVRKKLPFRTVFNILGPLCNPAPVTCQLLGVYTPNIIELIAQTLTHLELERALVVCGRTGNKDIWMDEVSVSDITVANLVDGKSIKRIDINPKELGVNPCDIKTLCGGERSENAAILRSILDRLDRGPRRDICLLNAAAGLYAAGIANDLSEGLKRAEESLDSGDALKKLEQLVAESNRAD